MRLGLLLVLLAGLAGCRQPKPVPAGKLGGIVLVIADGTSLELLTATRLYTGGAQGHLALDDFPHTAFVHTYSLSDLVTDSGAAATAMARGIKADNRVVGVADPQATTSPPSILDLAKKAGWSTAVLTDDSVTGATPAPFVVEYGDRSRYDVIAAKMVEQLGKRVDLIVGGGYQWFFDRSQYASTLYPSGQLQTVRQTQARLESLPIATFETWEKFRDYAPKDDKPVLAVFYPDQFPYYADGTRTLRLKDMVAKTVGLLQQRGKPFFLMAEAGLPDKACHLNNAKRAIVEVQELDATLAWLRKNLPPDVLLLVTTDHNNGGFTINGPPAPIRLKGEALLLKNPVTGGPYFTWASGPGFDRTAALQRTRLIAEPDKPLRSVVETIKETDVDYAQPALLDTKASLHSGGDVWMLADGPGSDEVHGFLDNTDIYRLMAGAIEQSTRPH